MSRLVYLDASALVKLVVDEPESAALTDYLTDEPRIVTSALSAVEVPRAVRMIDADEPALERAQNIVARCALIEVDRTVRDVAAGLDPPPLRTLDAIHLASALRVSEELSATVVYDRRLAAAARGAGLEVAAPGQLAAP
jgi:predicted nucleic acid-binding protein